MVKRANRRMYGIIIRDDIVKNKNNSRRHMHVITIVIVIIMVIVMVMVVGITVFHNQPIGTGTKTVWNEHCDLGHS